MAQISPDSLGRRRLDAGAPSLKDWDIMQTSQILGPTQQFRYRVCMPIPSAEQAKVAAEKVRDYLLNLEHPDGGSKAAWFHSLGYARERWQQLAEDLLAIARHCRRFESEATRFGIKYKAAGSVGRPNHRPGAVQTVWIVEDEDPPRLVTAYPDDER